jgi:hypothetical protein
MLVRFNHIASFIVNADHSIMWPVVFAFTFHPFHFSQYWATVRELGLDKQTAAKIKEIKQLRPLTGNQPWGIERTQDAAHDHHRQTFAGRSKTYFALYPRFNASPRDFCSSRLLEPDYPYRPIEQKAIITAAKLGT